MKMQEEKPGGVRCGRVGGCIVGPTRQRKADVRLRGSGGDRDLRLRPWGVAEVAREWLNDSALTQRVASGRHVACRVLEFELQEEMAGWDFGSWEQWTSQQPCHAMFIPLASDTSINKRL